MSWRPSRQAEQGSAVVEFVTLGVLILLPLVYLVLTLGRLQAGAFAVDGAAREAARTFIAAPDDATARARAVAAVRLGLKDEGFDADPATALTITCSATPCLTPKGRVAVQVAVDVVLPGIPGFVDRLASTHVTVRSEQVDVVDAFGPAAVAP
ncbi:MAG TPA: TadE family protein [Kineosporiaceae bacterium]|nr:TadE family protein [Kineosporiaceae bacterium]